MRNRLFIALDIPDKTLEQIIFLRNKIYGDHFKVKWEPKNKLHITLRFLGDVNESLTGSVITSIEKVAAESETIEGAFNQFGMFYKDGSPRILWLGAGHNKKLIEMQLRIENEMHILGFEKEKRSFKPHLTILRVKGFEDFEKLEKLKEAVFEEIKFSANSISLIKSELQAAGSVYKILKSFILKKSEE